jgi:pterin-4a-carbinolamine dehydratase
MADPFVFLNYRRSDAAVAAQALYLQLSERFGSRFLFMDVNSIEWGARWPDRIASQLRRANIVLPVIGEKWLPAADQYGRRRLDDPNDWVRLELSLSLRQRAQILPILLNDMTMPPPEALPDDLQPLSEHQGMTLRTGTEEWHRDLKLIGDRLHALGLPEREGAPQSLPAGLAKQRMPGLKEEELATALQDPDLRSWEPWEETLPNEYPLVRQELRRVFEFQTFSEAIRFINFLAPRFDRINHHPRWANEWLRVTIRLTTWAAGNRITQADLDVAHNVEQWHLEFRATSQAHDVA